MMGIVALILAACLLFACFGGRNQTASTGSRSTNDQVVKELGLQTDDSGRQCVVVPLTGGGAVANISRSTGAMYVSDGSGPRGKKEKECIVKVQVPLIGGSNPLMLYDQGRTMQTLVDGSGQAGRTMAAMIRAGGVGGLKGYFHAYKQGDVLRVYTDKLARPQAW